MYVRGEHKEVLLIGAVGRFRAIPGGGSRWGAPEAVGLVARGVKADVCVWGGETEGC